MTTPVLPYHSYSVDVLEDLMMDADEDQEALIVAELVKRGAFSKVCLKCGVAIGHGLWCKQHEYMALTALDKRGRSD